MERLHGELKTVTEQLNKANSDRGEVQVKLEDLESKEVRGDGFGTGLLIVITSVVMLGEPGVPGETSVGGESVPPVTDQDAARRTGAKV